MLSVSMSLHVRPSILFNADKVGAALKDRIVVRYINDFGQEEVGM